MSNDYEWSEQKRAIRLEVPAVGEPKPALRYRLFPPRFQRKLGNAAPLYRKAFEMAKALEENDSDRFESMRLLAIRDEESRKEWWGEDIPKELSSEEVVQFFEDYAELFAMLDAASLCAECDWELSLEDLNWWYSDGFRDLIPASYRTVRLLVIRTYYALGQSDTELAIRSIQNLYAFAKNLLQTPMVVHAILATGVANRASSCVADLITLGKLPNLYWALTQLPRFSYSHLQSVESERNDFLSYYPQLSEINNLARDEDHDYWREFGEKFLIEIQRHVDFDSYFDNIEEVKAEMGKSEEDPLPREEAKEKLRQELIESMAENYKDDPEGFEEYKKCFYPSDPQKILDELPVIKQAVLDWGYPAERVQRLCAEHLVAIYSVRVYEELYDEFTKWYGLDYLTCQFFLEGVGGEKIRQTIDSYRTKLAHKIAGTFCSAGYAALVQADQEIDALRIVEAVRLYASSHEGKLPKKLDKIKDVPIPWNPLTGKPFKYKVQKTAEGPIGILWFTTRDLQQNCYEIRIVAS